MEPTLYMGKKDECQCSICMKEIEEETSCECEECGANLCEECYIKHEICGDCE